jgi:hypothetical protein
MLRFFALAAVLRSAAAKNQNRDRAFRARKRECETQACAGLPPGTGANCVHACISQTCFDEVYAEEPLEDGEVDSKRARAFQSCARKALAAERERRRREERAEET